MGQDFYSILYVTRSASDADIKKDPIFYQKKKMKKTITF